MSEKPARKEPYFETIIKMDGKRVPELSEQVKTKLNDALLYASDGDEKYRALLTEAEAEAGQPIPAFFQIKAYCDQCRQRHDLNGM